jgi:hypothetical protein
MVVITAITPITLGGIARAGAAASPPMRWIALALPRCRADHAPASDLEANKKMKK